jgi:hypothetical protein
MTVGSTVTALGAFFHRRVPFSGRWDIVNASGGEKGRKGTALAQRTIVQLEDDLDGGPADTTVSFAFEGTAYEIDLNSDNAAKMRDVFAPYTASARKAGRGGARRAATASRRSSGNRTNDIREWARENGFTVNDRGRLSREVVDAYEAAH